jgi:hypothetical protein
VSIEKIMWFLSLLLFICCIIICMFWVTTKVKGVFIELLIIF